MPTLQEQLQTAVDQTTADSTIFHNIVHGDTVTEVVTENGNVKSLAKVVAENQQTLSASIATLTAMRDQSVASAGNAALSESNSATSETNVANAEANVLSAVGAVANNYLFDDAIVMGDPTVGVLRLDNANISLATNIALSAQTAETTSPDISEFIKTWGNSTSLIKGVLTFRKVNAPQIFVIFAVTGVVTDNNTWLQAPITYIAGSGVFALSDDLYISFTRNGDKGDGDVIAANNLAELTDMVQARNNLGLGSAALKNIGVAVGEMPVLEAGGKLPAIDGSQLTGLSGFSQINKQIITTSGTYIPSPGMIFCLVEAVAGGGGSAGASGVGSSTGGGGAEYVRSLFTAAAIGASKPIIIGAGGTSGNTSTAGGTGGDTTFGATLLIAKGGTGAGIGSSVANNWGIGGIGGTGDFKVPGENGGGAINYYGAHAGRGGSSLLGHGGSAPTASSGNYPAQVGKGYGAGASGTVYTSTGAAGTNGVMIITEFIA